jgi:hypothetical protein
MHPIDVLPDSPIQPVGQLSRLFLEREILSFQAACRYVKAMPYGSNSNHEDSLILFQEERGTCTTKHGAIARLAQELRLEVYKNLGFYRLNDEIVTGVSRLLEPQGLSFIPQIHCFLEYGTFRVDLTEGNCNGKNKTIEAYDFVVRVSPDLTRVEEEQYYLSYLNQYFTIDPQLAIAGIPTILKLLEACNRQVKYQCSIMSSSHLASVVA